MSQAELARRVGMQPSHLNHFLRGRGDVRVSRLLKILEALDVDLIKCLSAYVSVTQSELQSNSHGKFVDEDISVKWLRWSSLDQIAVRDLLANLDAHIKKTHDYAD